MSRKCGVIPLCLLGASVAFATYAVMRSDDRTPDAHGNTRALIALNNEMIRAHGCGDLAGAERTARKILSQSEWRTFVPANAVMGSVLAQKGEYAAAAAFFEAALSGRGFAPQPVVMNDYADTLRHLGRYAEAEDFARRAIAASGGKVPLYKLTLDEILNEAKTHKENAKEKKT